MNETILPGQSAPVPTRLKASHPPKGRRGDSKALVAPPHQHRAVNHRAVGTLAAEVRRPTRGKLDLRATLRELEVTMRTRTLPETLWGLTVGTGAILVNSRLCGADRLYAAAHEIAHVLVRRGRCRVRSRADEEAFADAFAQALLG